MPNCRTAPNRPPGKCHYTRRGCQRANPWIEFLTAHGKLGHTRAQLSQLYANARANPAEPRLIGPPWDAHFPQSNANREAYLCPYTRYRQNPELSTANLGLALPKQTYLTRQEFASRRVAQRLPFFDPPNTSQRFYLGKAGVGNPRSRIASQNDVSMFTLLPRDPQETVHYGPVARVGGVNQYLDVEFDELPFVVSAAHNIFQAQNAFAFNPTRLHTINAVLNPNNAQHTQAAAAVQAVAAAYNTDSQNARARYEALLTHLRGAGAMKELRLVRQYTKCAVHLVMYFRRWGGPNTPLPIAYANTTQVGQVSNSIPANARNLVDTRLGHMETRLCATLQRLFNAMSPTTRNLLRAIPTIQLKSVRADNDNHVFVKANTTSLVTVLRRCCNNDLCVRLGSSDSFQAVAYLYRLLFRRNPLGMTDAQFKRGVASIG